MDLRPLLLQRIPALTYAVLIAVVAVSPTYAVGPPSIASLNKITTISTTVPSNGDLNPYGVARIQVSKGRLVAGEILVSNFNNSDNLQGTGTTIVQIAPDGGFSLFAEINPVKVSCPGGIGLTTALAVLRSGFVIVGSLPAPSGSSADAEAGCLIVLDRWGKVIETFSGDGINGRWDMTAVDFDCFAVLFVTNVLNGTVAASGDTVNRGTVLRLLLEIPEDRSPRLLDSSVIASGFSERTDPNALVIGPTGVAFDDRSGTLYVADTLNNRIAAIPNALFRFFPAHTGFTVSEDGALNAPLGLCITHNHRLIAANGGDGNLVEINPETGIQTATKQVDGTGGPPTGAGALFGLIAVEEGVYFVDDASNTLNLLH